MAAGGGRLLAVTTLRHVGALGVAVIGTFALLWWPFCVYAAPGETCTGGVAQVLRRLFPFQRGIFEDKVANVWCMLSQVLKLHLRMSQQTLIRMCTLTTLVLCLPACLSLALRPALPGPLGTKRFLYGLTSCGLAFFLVSYQVRQVY